MSKTITILYATMTGTAEMVAEEVEQELSDADHEIALHMMDDIDVDIFNDGGIFLVCTSTYGLGNVPDNAQELVESLEASRPDLSNVTYGVIALGDMTYDDTFCDGGRYFDELLSSLGARRVGDIMQHDAGSSDLPEEIAPEWALEWVDKLD